MQELFSLYEKHKKEAKIHIHSFAVRYLELFNDLQVNYLEFESCLGEERQRLSFDMDAGESFINQYSREVFYDADELEHIIDKVDSVELLCNCIFSQWRYITHWAESPLLYEDNKKWFLIALSRLAELTS